eukprot:scaffold8397_cov104-Skeletonema_dohrnii-CCMP3373.AAC.3
MMGTYNHEDEERCIVVRRATGSARICRTTRAAPGASYKCEQKRRKTCEVLSGWPCKHESKDLTYQELVLMLLGPQFAQKPVCVWPRSLVTILKRNLLHSSRKGSTF